MLIGYTGRFFSQGFLLVQQIFVQIVVVGITGAEVPDVRRRVQLLYLLQALAAGLVVVQIGLGPLVSADVFSRMLRGGRGIEDTYVARRSLQLVQFHPAQEVEVAFEDHDAVG